MNRPALQTGIGGDTAQRPGGGDADAVKRIVPQDMCELLNSRLVLALGQEFDCELAAQRVGGVGQLRVNLFGRRGEGDLGQVGYHFKESELNQAIFISIIFCNFLCVC